MSFKPIYILKNWVKEKNLISEGLSKNPNAIAYLKENPSMINWKYVCQNKNGSELLINYLNKHNFINQKINIFDNITEDYYRDTKDYYRNNFLKKKNKIRELENTPGIDIFSNHTYRNLTGSLDIVIPEEFNCEEEKKIFEKTTTTLPKNIKLDIPSNLHLNFIAEHTDSLDLLDLCLKEYKNNEYEIIVEMLKNPNAYPFIIKYIDELDNRGWDNISKNPHPLIVEILGKNMDKVNIINLCGNSSAIHLVEKFIEDFFIYDENSNTYCINNEKRQKTESIGIYYQFDFCLNALATNKNALHLIYKYFDHFDPHFLCKNENPDIINIIRMKLESGDPMDFFKKHTASFVKNEYLLDLISDYSHYIPFLNSDYLKGYTGYPNIFRIMSGMGDPNWEIKCNWERLSENPGIFQIDRLLMKNQCKDFAEELAAYVFHPDRIFRISYTYGIAFDELLEIY